MADGFSFPPPPPPPPKAAAAYIQSYDNAPVRGKNVRGGRGDRGNRGGRGSFRGRGGQQQRGDRQANYGPRPHAQSNGAQRTFDRLGADTLQRPAMPSQPVSASPMGTYSGPARQDSRPFSSQHAQPYGHLSTNSGHTTFSGHKRDREQAFGQDHRHPMRKPANINLPPKVPAAPAVPSFGRPLFSSSATSSSVTARNPTNQKRSVSLFNLNADLEQDAGSDDDGGEDVDEEAAYAASVATGPLTFEHNGETATLRTPADIAAWKAERKRLWPSRRRIEEKKEEVHQRQQERKRIDEETRLSAFVSQAPAVPEKPVLKQLGRQKEQTKQRKVSAPEAELQAAREVLEQQMQKVQELQARLAESQAQTTATTTTEAQHEQSDTKLLTINNEPSPLRTVTVLNLPADIEEQRIRETFASCGNLLSVDVFNDGTTMSAYAVIEFETPEGAAKARVHDGSDLGGLHITVKPAGPMAPHHKATITPELQAAAKNLAGIIATTDILQPSIDLQQPDVGSHAEVAQVPQVASDSISSNSDSDSDSAPEEMASKPEQPIRVAPQQPRPEPKACSSFANTGSCKFGAKCRFKHVAAPMSQKSSQAGRKTLYQRLVETERDEENKLVLQAIKHLGSVGFFSKK